MDALVVSLWARHCGRLPVSTDDGIQLLRPVFLTITDDDLARMIPVMIPDPNITANAVIAYLRDEADIFLPDHMLRTIRTLIRGF